MKTVPTFSLLGYQGAGARGLPCAAPGAGIEPTCDGSEPSALPLGYPGMCVVGQERIELSVFGLRGRCFPI